MKGFLYSVFDIVAEELHPPFYAANDNVALRQLGMALNKPGIRVNDYRLYRLCPWDPQDRTDKRFEFAVVLQQKEIPAKVKTKKREGT